MAQGHSFKAPNKHWTNMTTKRQSCQSHNGDPTYAAILDSSKEQRGQK